MRCRLVAVEPNYRGFGLVVLENNNRIVDSGLVQIRPWSLRGVGARLNAIADLYRPDALILPNSPHERFTRRAAIIRCARSTFTESGAAVVEKSDSEIKSFHGAETLLAVAGGMVNILPELEPLYPPRRRPWMSQDERQLVLIAAARAFAALSSR